MRLVNPEALPQVQELQVEINKKHIADGVNSPLINYYLEQKIVAADDTAAIVAAITSNSKMGVLKRQAENSYALRNLLFNPVFLNVQSEVQFLKKLKKGKVSELGDWGITVNGNKIVYPALFDRRVELVKTFYTKHLSYAPGTSPLQPFITEQNIVVVTEGKATDDAVTADTAAAQQAKDGEDMKKQRDNFIASVLLHQAGIGGYLMSLKIKNQKAVGEWGFTVDDSPQAPKLQKTTILPADKITVNSVVIGSTLTNTGIGTLHIYKGKSTTGTPVVVEAGDKLGMIKGYSSVTAINPSTLEKGIFMVLRYQ